MNNIFVKDTDEYKRMNDKEKLWVDECLLESEMMVNLFIENYNKISNNNKVSIPESLGRIESYAFIIIGENQAQLITSRMVHSTKLLFILNDIINDTNKLTILINLTRNRFIIEKGKRP